MKVALWLFVLRFLGFHFLLARLGREVKMV